jgi:hypothetical protein
MKLAKKLKRIVTKIERSETSRHKSARNHLVRAIHKAINKIGTSELSQGLQVSIEKLVNSCLTSADFVDAADHVRELVFQSANGYIHDIRIKPKQGLNVYLNQLKDEFESGSLKFRPYVYVLWRAKSPNKFYYIGRATNMSRLLGTNHNKLAASFPLCTNISIVFPGLSNDSNIKNLEASLIRLVEFEFKKLPENNSKREVLDGLYTSNSLSEVGKFLQKIGKQLDYS